MNIVAAGSTKSKIIQNPQVAFTNRVSGRGATGFDFKAYIIVTLRAFFVFATKSHMTLSFSKDGPKVAM